VRGGLVKGKEPKDKREGTKKTKEGGAGFFRGGPAQQEGRLGVKKRGKKLKICAQTAHYRPERLKSETRKAWKRGHKK